MTPTDHLIQDQSPLPPLGEVLDFMRLIWAVDHALQRMSKQMEKTIGVTGPQRLVLRIVGRFPGISAGELARMLHLHPSTLTGILARLERQGSIRRRPDPRDKRRTSLGLTQRGRQFDVAAEGTIESAVSRALAKTSARKIRAARDVLLSIADSLETSQAGRPYARAGSTAASATHRRG
jgi:DNA-binding MarR family transcriptional regulator